MFLSSWLSPHSFWLKGLILWACVGILAFIVGRFAHDREGAFRRVFAPAVLVTLLGLILDIAPRSVLAGTPFETIEHCIWLSLWLLIINASGLLIFRVVLPRFFSLPRIAHELSIGAAYLVLILFFLRRFGVDFSSLLATSAVVTAIVAISMQATLGNAFGGLTLQLDRSVNEGDWVRLDDGTEGRVCSVRWRHTVIETRNWDTVIVPNSLLMGQKFQILGKRENAPLQHRMWVYFNVDFRYAPADVIEAVETGLRSAPILGTAKNPAANCVCMDFVQPDSAIRYAVRYFLTDLAADDPTSSLVRTRVYAALRRARIPLAVPAATLFVENNDIEATERKAQKELRKRLEAVRRMTLCQKLTDEEQEHLARELKFSPYAAGEVISREGAPANWLYILDRGEVEVRVSHNGKDVPLNTLRAPDYFGEQGMLTGSPRTATVVALTEVECFRLDSDTFNDVLQSRPSIVHDMASVVSQRQEERSAFLESLPNQGDRVSKADGYHQLLSRMQDFFGLNTARK